MLALDRAFDTHQIVLLHAYAGAGKTSIAAEFTRWYTATGGLDDGGAVLWTSFEHYQPLPRVLDVIGAHFSALLEANGIHWAAITDPATRLNLALQILTAVPVVWVWDNVEPVTGFPTGTPSAWTVDEQHELAEFLHTLRSQTRVRVLLTSRRPEEAWLGTLPVRVALPPMPLREQLQLAHALAPTSDVDWRRLLEFTGGNPLTITVTVRQALREHVTTTDQLQQFVARVQAGHTGWETTDDAAQGRDASLAASLGYGFTHAFTEAEQARLAVLHLFRDTVDADALRYMGDSDVADNDVVPALAGMDRDAWISLLDRAAEIGLLTGYGGGYYGIHPALPWFFTTLYTNHHPDTTARVERGYTRAYATLGDYYARQVEDGRGADVLAVLRVEEANLRHAFALARTHHLPEVVLGCLQGLRQLYTLTGRDVEWARLVADIQGDYLDPATDQPRPGRDDQYPIVMSYRVEIARAQRDWPTATRLQTAVAAVIRARAAAFLDLPPDRLDDTARNRLRSLAVTEQDLGRLLREQGDPACLSHYHSAHDLFERIGDTAGQTSQASNLGNAYLFVPGLRDLDQAQHWHQRALDLKPDHDRIGRAAAHGSLATAAYQRFLDARAAGAPATTLVAHLDTARAGHQRALDLLPADHHDYRATIHNQLGILYAEVGDVPQALRHYQQSIQHMEARGDVFGAGQSRFNIALLLERVGRGGDALHYARAALGNFQIIGPGATDQAGRALSVIESLEQAAANSTPDGESQESILEAEEMADVIEVNPTQLHMGASVAGWVDDALRPVGDRDLAVHTETNRIESGDSTFRARRALPPFLD